MATILVVDDETPIVDLLRDFFEDDGHIVLTAQNGHSALEIAREQHPDIVLSDIMMPVMSGTELLTALHNETETSTITVILMSAGNPPDIAKMGEVQFIGKPFQFDRLHHIIIANLP